MDIANLIRQAPAAHVDVERLETAIKTLQDGLAAKHIWNVDYNEAKDRISRAWEHIDDVAHDYLTDMYYRGNDKYKSWQDGDPRFNMGLCGFLNTPGWVKKLKAIKNAPELVNYIAVIDEVAALVELVKSVKPYIQKGRKPSENPKEIDYTNTGICPVCTKRQKLTFDSQLVAHGYTLDRKWMGRNGMCFGRGHLAWELSPEGAEAYIVRLKAAKVETEKALKALRNSTMSELSEYVRVRKEFGRFENEKRTYAKGTAEYEKVRSQYIWSNESDLRQLDGDIETYTERVANWKEQPLQYGGAETQERWQSRFLNKPAK